MRLRKLDSAFRKVGSKVREKGQRMMPLSEFPQDLQIDTPNAPRTLRLEDDKGP
jgi:hypothetical protein